jgi:hypothetical protein
MPKVSLQQHTVNKVTVSLLHPDTADAAIPLHFSVANTGFR